MLQNRFIFKHDIEIGKYFDSKKTQEGDKKRGTRKKNIIPYIHPDTFIQGVVNGEIERLNAGEGESTKSGILLADDSRNLSTGIEEMQ